MNYEEAWRNVYQENLKLREQLQEQINRNIELAQFISDFGKLIKECVELEYKIDEFRTF